MERGLPLIDAAGVRMEPLLQRRAVLASEESGVYLSSDGLNRRNGRDRREEGMAVKMFAHLPGSL